MSASLLGVEAVPITVEVVVSSGIPGMSIVGMADKAVQEAKERVKAAIRASGFSMPADKIVVNLAPGDMKKSGAGFDLPIAMGILAATQQISTALLRDRMFVGELSLEGNVRTVAGMLAFGMCAAKAGYGLVSASGAEAPIAGLEQMALTHLCRLQHDDPLVEVAQRKNAHQELQVAPALDFGDISGQEVAKRAIQIAAAGSHGLLMVGPPGSGKTMLASRIPTILPPLEEREMLEAALVHSVAGEDTSFILAGRRPFRHPHHSASMPGLLGGGSPVRPGEVTLAHRGVLFLDELAEFNPHVLQGLRQPIEDGEVCITRAAGNVKMPARFMLVAATNPCPCGYFGDSGHECTCTTGQIHKYQSRIGAPLMDRLDLQLDVHRLPTSNILEAGSGADSATLRAGVIAARSFAAWRRERNATPDAIDALRPRVVASKSSREVIEECQLESEERQFVVTMADARNLSGRAIVNTLGVARTIADMAESLSVKTEHLAEAFGFRLSEGFGV